MKSDESGKMAEKTSDSGSSATPFDLNSVISQIFPRFAMMFECERCGGAVGMFCHCPPRPPQGTTAEAQRYEKWKSTEKELSRWMLMLERQLRASEGLSCSSEQKAFADIAEEISRITTEMNALVRAFTEKGL